MRGKEEYESGHAVVSSAGGSTSKTLPENSIDASNHRWVSHQVSSCRIHAAPGSDMIRFKSDISVWIRSGQVSSVEADFMNTLLISCFTPLLLFQFCYAEGVLGFCFALGICSDYLDLPLILSYTLKLNSDKLMRYASA